MHTRPHPHESPHPLVARNAGEEMVRIFSPQTKFSTWRRLWLYLAETEKELGVAIPDAALEQMRAAVDQIDFARAAELERQLRHDVMAHVHAFGEQCPAAKPFVHLGATSCYVTDNTELIQMRSALKLVAGLLANVVDALGRFAEKHRALATLGFTHFQPAQLTTVGKRATLWCQDFAMDLSEVEHRLAELKARGARGTTGTQASFLALFNGDHAKVQRLADRVAERMGFAASYPVVGQTYPRKVDHQIASALAGVAASVHKFANDVRLLANGKEMEEPFEETQVGSSAMAYKRNPMRCERATGLARLVLSYATSPAMTAAEQWLERTLDDSSNRRVVIPDMFYAADGMLRIVLNVAGGLVVYPATIAARVAAELPFMATEDILVAAVTAGGDRQDLHERLRVHSQAAAGRVKNEGAPNDLIDRLKADKAFARVNLDDVLDPSRYVGRAPQQVDEFIEQVVAPIRKRYADALGESADLHV
jgi:adenylosuccinate lyase